MSKKLEIMEISELTMSSLEIASLTDKRHDHVIRDIENMMDELEIGHPKFGGTYLSIQNKKLPCYNLPKRETLILVSGYSIKLRSRIIDRWLELEASLNEEKLRIAARERARLDAPKMTLALKTSLEDAGKQPKWYHFANEHNLLYRAAFGKTCKELLDEIGEDANLRDHLTFNQISLLEDLQRADEFFIESGMDYHERKLRIEKMVSKRALHLIQEEKV